MNSQALHKISQDEARIRSTIHSFSALADQGAFEYLGRLFAPVVSVDYTSLFGGEVKQTPREVLMQRWESFLPGFDTTYHELRDLKVELTEHGATVNVDFTASHWLGDEGFWEISGEYEFTLEIASPTDTADSTLNAPNQWQITGVKAIGKRESGSRDVLGEVAKFAEQNHLQRQAQRLKL